jgi:hypothetical protein
MHKFNGDSETSSEIFASGVHIFIGCRYKQIIFFCHSGISTVIQEDWTVASVK